MNKVNFEPIKYCQYFCELDKMQNFSKQPTCEIAGTDDEESKPCHAPNTYKIIGSLI